MLVISDLAAAVPWTLLHVYKQVSLNAQFNKPIRPAHHPLTAFVPILSNPDPRSRQHPAQRSSRSIQPWRASLSTRSSTVAHQAAKRTLLLRRPAICLPHPYLLSISCSPKKALSVASRCLHNLEVLQNHAIPDIVSSVPTMLQVLTNRLSILMLNHRWSHRQRSGNP